MEVDCSSLLLLQQTSFDNQLAQQQPIDVTMFSSPLTSLKEDTNQSQRKEFPSREVEEEIANLLVEFKHHDPATLVTGRRFPSFSSERTSFFDDSSEDSSASPVQKRRRTSIQQYEKIETESFSSGSSSFSSKRRRNTDSLQNDSEFDYSNSDVEYEEEEPINEADDEYLDDDGDWFESSRGSLGSTSSISYSPSGSARVPRKKAPSGSACEKHKRWKKRCPDDCPMRTSKQPRRRKPTASISNVAVKGASSFDAYDDIQSSPRDDYGHDIAEEFQIESTKLNAIESQDIIKNLFKFVSEAKVRSQPTRSDFVSLIRWSMQQLSNEGNIILTPQETSSVEALLLRKILAEDSFLESPASRSRRTRTLKSEESTPTAQITTMACEKHTALHARCPPNCVDRRTVEVINKSKKRSLKSDDSESEDFTLSPATSRKRDASRPKSTKSSSKGRTGRKYLPQACDRHKMLHAKCPANCPDRIKRDAEAAKNRLQENPSTPPSETLANTP